MNNIQIVSNLSITEAQLQCSEANGKKVNAFFRQGDLDNACAIYSLMMLLLISSKVKRSELEGTSKGKGFTGVRRLQHEFLYERKDVFKEGYYFDKLSADLKRAFSKYTETESYCIDENTANEDLHSKILKELEEDRPVEIGFSRKGRNGGGHAVLAVGYQMLPNKIRLFCLDPAYEMPKCSYWNNIIDLSTDYRSKATYLDYNHVEDQLVNVDQILTVR